MIKEIIASILLTTSIGTPIISKDNSANTTYAIKGYYCFYDEYDWSHYEPVTFNGRTYTIYDYNELEYENFYPVVYQYGGYTSLNYLNIVPTFNEDDDVCFDVTYSTGEPVTYRFTFEDLLEDKNVYACNTLIYFPETIYLDSVTYEIFSCVFSYQPNAYMTTYSGYYSFGNNTLNVNTSWDVVGNIIVNNNLYEHVFYSTGNAYAYLGNTTYKFIDNGVLKTSQNILLNQMMLPTYEYQKMELTGIFAYQVSPMQYTFGDMIFNVIDAPIYMLSQLFSFELFGIELYVAFTGVLTLLLMMFLVRKMI